MAILLAVLTTGAACGGDRSSSQSSDPGADAAPAGAVSADAAPAGDTTAAGRRVPDATAARPRAVFLGTSLTAGLGLDPDSAYPAILQRMADSAGLAVRMVNAGLSGETSAGALRRASWALAEPAALVVLEVGANDGLRGVDPDSTRANLVALIDTVRRIQPSAAVVLVQMESPPNLGADYTARFRAAYPAAAEATGVPLVPFLLDGVAGEPTLNQADGIHPTEAGARIVAGNLWRSLAGAFRRASGEAGAGAAGAGGEAPAGGAVAGASGSG